MKVPLRSGAPGKGKTAPLMRDALGCTVEREEQLRMARQLLDAGYRGLKAQLDAKKLKEMRKVKAMLLKRF
jgi:hypothetical protein